MQTLGIMIRSERKDEYIIEAGEICGGNNSIYILGTSFRTTAAADRLDEAIGAAATVLKCEIAQQRISQKNRYGFTLIELLVCAVVLAALMALALPGLAKSRAASRDLACRANLHQLQEVTFAYSRDYQGLPVAAAQWPDDRVAQLELPPSSWLCTADPWRGQHSSSYMYWAPFVVTAHSPPGSPRPWLALRLYEQDPGAWIFAEFASSHGWRNAITWAGQVERE